MFIGHWKKLHLKVSQGGARETRINSFLLSCKNLTKVHSRMFSMIIAIFTDFGANIAKLFADKNCKTAQKHEIVR